MTTTFLLIRHGQTDWNVNGRWQGHTDIPLNEAGKTQAQAIAQRLASWPIRAIYSSDLQRAAMTAAPVAAALNLKPIFDPVWRERDMGDFSGLTSQEVRQQYPQFWQARSVGSFSPPNGEDNLELRSRVVAAYDLLLERHAGEMIAIVSHGGALANVIAHAMEIPPGRYGRFSLRGNTGLSIIEKNERYGQRVVLLNDTCHLMHLEVT